MNASARPLCAIALGALACATTPPAPASRAPAAAPRAISPEELDRKLDAIADKSVATVLGEGPVPQLAPPPPDGGLPAGLEELTIPAADGLKLRAWLVPPTTGPARATVLVLPGWASAIEWALGQSRFLLDHGYRLLLLDPRANRFIGRASEFQGFVKEDLADIDAALDFVQRRPDVAGAPLAVYGFSWGGFKAVMAAQRRPELKAVVDDAGPLGYYLFLGAFFEFAPPAVRGDEAVIRSYLAKVDARLRARAGYGLEDFHVERAAASLSPRPLLVIHSDDDDFVPLRASEAIYAAAREPRQLLRAKDFGHCLGMRRNPAAYIPPVVAFLAKAIP